VSVSVSDLPHLNAALNATSAVLLGFAWWHIKQRHIQTHRRLMITAFITSSCFLASYLVYHAQIGSKPFPGTGLARTIYFSILIPHVLLAAVVLPMAIVTLRRGLRRDDARHRRIARWTMPLWMFVSVSGVVVYVMLYQW
jgi:putative membrane protein